MKMKMIFVPTIIAVLGLFGCSHNPAPPEIRAPNQASSYAMKDTGSFSVQGRVGFSENKVESGTENDAEEHEPFFFVQIDCSGDWILDREEQGRIIKIPAHVVSPAQRHVYMTMKKRAEQQSKKASAMPYARVDGIALFRGENPCKGGGVGKVYQAFSANFSKAKR